MPTNEPRQPPLIDKIQALVLQSVKQAHADKRHGHDELRITYHAGEIKQIEFAPRTVYR